MGGIKTQIYFAFKRLGLRDTFLRMNFLRRRWMGTRFKEFDALQRFYKPFVQPGDLVFDVGTNIGNRSEVFDSLQARIVCVEPNPKLFGVIKFRFANKKNITAINAGCGAVHEVKEFNIGNNHLVSTFSDKFIEHKISHEGVDKNWEKKEQIQLVTLDELVSAYGTPQFCKIDVEGYEKQVLQGLSTKIGTVSFEFTSPTFNEDSMWCVEKLASLGYAQFNISIGETLTFAHATWISVQEMTAYIRTSPAFQRPTYGDIYAR